MQLVALPAAAWALSLDHDEVRYELSWWLWNYWLLLLVQPVLVILHEAGHALMAWYCGFQVTGVILGQGWKLLEFRWRGVKYTVCGLVNVGVVQYMPKPVPGMRLRTILVIAAGPLVHVLFAAACGLAWWAGWGRLAYRPGFWWVEVLLLANLWLLCGIVRRRQVIDGEARTSDGVQLYRLLTLSGAQATAMEAAQEFAREVDRLITTGHPMDALALTQKALEIAPMDFGLWNRRLNLLLRQGGAQQAREEFRRALGTMAPDAQLRPTFLLFLAEVDMVIGTPDVWWEAHTAASEAVKLRPGAIGARLIAACVFAQGGDPNQAVASLTDVLKEDLEPAMRAVGTAFLAMAQLSAGRQTEAVETLRAAQRLAPGHYWVHRAAQKIATTEPAQIPFGSVTLTVPARGLS